MWFFTEDKLGGKLIVPKHADFPLNLTHKKNIYTDSGCHYRRYSSSATLFNIIYILEPNFYIYRSSSRYDLVSVTALPSDRERASCTTKAIVSAVSRYPERENAIILAEDESNN